MPQDESFRTVMPEGTLPRGAVGDMDETTTGISPSVVEAMSSADDGHRASILRNLEPIMSPKDRQYVRSQTADPVIRGIVGEA